MLNKFMICLIFTAFIAAASGKPACADDLYKKPPADLVKLTEDYSPRLTSVSPTGAHLLILEKTTYPPIAQYAKNKIPLAGLKVYPAEKRPERERFLSSLTLVDCMTGEETSLPLPQPMFFDPPRWSSDGKHFAFTSDGEKGLELWLGNTGTKTVEKIENGLTGIFTDGFSWQSDDLILFYRTAGENPPEKPALPPGPAIEENDGTVKKSVTYQNLLKNDFDEQCFEYYATVQPVLYRISTGETRLLGKPDMYADFSLSPDGGFFFVQKIEKPFSRKVPYYFFAMSYEVWTEQGERTACIARRPVQDNKPFDGVPTGPRMALWSPACDARLIWVEALDGGDSAGKAALRDRIVFRDFSKDNAGTVGEFKDRVAGITFLDGENRALIATTDRKTRWTETVVAEMTENGKRSEALFSRNQKDAYNDPGAPVTARTPNQTAVAVFDGERIFLDGDGASPQGDFPFLAACNLRTGEREVLFRSGEKAYDYFIRFAPGGRILISRENTENPPNIYSRELTGGMEKQLTFHQDPFPELRGIKKEIIRYKRYDGTQLSGTLYLPAGWKEGDNPLPLLMWAYPREYTDPSVAGQIRGSHYNFTQFPGYSPLLFATQGYAVLNNASMPVIGSPDTKNDTFVRQITGSAKAAIDYLAQRKIADPKRVVVGGHSYGAFMTANLLAHSDLFAAGIARSGAYNRTLTPFGFQDEKRSFWEAPDVYIKMSPFTYADKIKTPILLIHGMEDSNSGTYPLQSQRFYEALKANGATCRLVMLPFEEHGYRAKESVLTTTAEMLEWADKYTGTKR